MLTNAFALNMGFDVDIKVLSGKSSLGTFALYKDNEEWDEFVSSVDLHNDTYTHWHPYTKEEALNDVVAFMQGTLKLPL